MFPDGNIGRSVYFGCDEFNILTIDGTDESTDGDITPELRLEEWPGECNLGIKSNSW